MSNKLGVEHQPESHLLPAWWIFGVAIPSQKGFARHLPPGAQSRWEGFSSISGECRCMGRGTSTIESSYCWWFRCDIPNNRLGCTKPWKNNGIFTISTGERRSSEPSTLCIYNMYIYICILHSPVCLQDGSFQKSYFTKLLGWSFTGCNRTVPYRWVDVVIYIPCLF